MEVDGKAKHGQAPTDARDSKVQHERPDRASEAQLLAGTAEPYNYYQSGPARARHEVFVRRGKLTRALTALGLPPVYEHPKGILVGRQVAAQPEAAGAAPAAAAWRRLRTQAANPARNPVMARNIRVKAQLAAAAARGAAAGQPKPSGRMLRQLSALDVASRTIAKLHMAPVGSEARRLGSAPLSKPYYPRRRRGGVPANEAEGGDRWPGRLARRAAEQAAEEEAQAVRARRGSSEEAQRRQAQIQELADVIVAAPHLGIHELGAYLPHERAEGSDTSALATTAEAAAPLTDEPCRTQAMASAVADATTTAMPTADLLEALRQLEICAAAGRATVAAAEDDYGSQYAVRAAPRGAAIAIPALSPVASSYGSGGHYLYEEGMAEGENDYDSHGGASADGENVNGDSGGGARGESAVPRDSDSGAGADVSAAAAEPPASQLPAVVTTEANLTAGLVVIRYPAGSGVIRQRARARTPYGGRLAALERSAQIHASAAAAATPYALDSLRRPDAGLGNEVLGGRRHRGPADPAVVADTTQPSAPLGADKGERADGANTLQSSSAPPADAATEATTNERVDATRDPTSPLPPPVPPASASASAQTAAALAAARAAAAMVRLPNEVSYAGRVRRLQQLEIAGKDLSGVWAEAAVVAATARPCAGVTGRRARGGAAPAEPPTPSWRRESHAERSEALLAAAAAASEEQAKGEELAPGPSAEAGNSHRTAVRAGQATAAAPMTVARKVAAAAGDGGGGGRADRVDRWGGVQIGRTVAVAVVVPSAIVEPATASAVKAGAADPAAAAGATVTAPPASASAAAADAATATGASAVADRSAGRAAVPPGCTERAAVAERVARFLSSLSGGGDDGDGPSLDRFVMLSDAEGEADDDSAEEAGGEAERASEGDREGPARPAATASPPARRRRGQGRGRGPAPDDLWDSSSDEENPWGVEAADEMGYPQVQVRVSWVGPARSAAAAVAPVGRAAAAAAEAGVAKAHTSVGLEADLQPGPSGLGGAMASADVTRDDGSRGSSNSGGSWGVDNSPAAEPKAGLGGGAAGGGAGGRSSGPLGPQLTADVLRRLASAATPRVATTSPPLTKVPPVAAAAVGASAGTGGAAGLRQVFGLAAAHERVVDPRDVPPLPLTPPPEWLLGRSHGSERRDEGEQARGSSTPLGPAAGSSLTKNGSLSEERQQPIGQVEAAILRAKSKASRCVVRHDSRTFYFSDDPAFSAPS